MDFNRNNLITSAAVLGALLISACASAPTAPEPEPTLEEAEFQGILHEATGPLGSKADSEEEANYAAILARTDLSAQQRAQTYIDRAIMRSDRSPVCAVSDYRKGLALYPDHPARATIEEEIAKELERQKKYPQNFVGPDAFEDCDPLAE